MATHFQNALRLECSNHLTIVKMDVRRIIISLEILDVFCIYKTIIAIRLYTDCELFRICLNRIIIIYKNGFCSVSRGGLTAIDGTAFSNFSNVFSKFNLIQMELPNNQKTSCLMVF